MQLWPALPEAEGLALIEEFIEVEADKGAKDRRPQLAAAVAAGHSGKGPEWPSWVCFPS